jgi:hypothetical protein
VVEGVSRSIERQGFVVPKQLGLQVDLGFVSSFLGRSSICSLN